MKNNEIEIKNTTDPGIFKSDFEKNLYKKINEIKKYYSSINGDENYEKSLSILAEAKTFCGIVYFRLICDTTRLNYIHSC